MADGHVNEYTPDSVSLPGETLQEVLDERQMTQADLAERMGRPKKTVNEIIQGKAAITPETALQLERVLGVPALLEQPGAEPPVARGSQRRASRGER